jgi:outer membrane immunogenic protein
VHCNATCNTKGILMKKILMVGFALGALIAPAVAADMPVKAPPPPPRVSTWTGCYLGGSVGGVWRQSEGTSVTVVDGGSGAAAAAAAGAIPTSYSYGGSSWLGGGQLGCNYQASSWVFGAETDMSGTKLNGGETLNTNVPLFFPLTSSVSQETHWIGTTRARLGMTWGNVLLYGTGGAAYANMNYAYAQSNIAGGGPVAIAAGDSATRFGWTAGGGIEVGFGAWSIKGEYLFYDLGHHTLGAVCGTCTGLAPTVFFANFHDSGSIARLGLNYHLN